MNLITKKSVYQLTVKEIDELINQLEQGVQCLLFDIHDINKTLKLQDIIGFLIDVRCEKLGINI
jgi:hypothetical protein